MTKVNVAKLLKNKNRITAEITRVKSKMNQHNAFIVSKDVPEGSEAIQVNVPQLAQELQTLTSKLVRVKIAISRANVKSVDKIFEMAELKGQIAFYNGLDCTTTNSRGYGYNENDVKRVQIKLA